MKILIYGNRKQDDAIYDISTPEKEEAAFKAVFATLDGYWRVYADLQNFKEPEICEPCQKDLHRLCESSDCGCKPCSKVHDSLERICDRDRWAALYVRAKTGEFAAIKKLMEERSNRNYEYETFHYGKVKDATEETLKASQ